MDIISNLTKIKIDIEKIKNNINIISNSRNGMNILLKGTTGNEPEKSTGSENYVLIEEENYNLSIYPTYLFWQFGIYGKWELKSSENTSTSYLKVEITITTNQNPIILNPIEFHTQSTSYNEYNYSNIVMNERIPGTEIYSALLNLNLKWYMKWLYRYSGGESTSGGEIIPRPGGEIPPPIPPPVPSTAYGKYLYLLIGLY